MKVLPKKNIISQDNFLTKSTNLQILSVVTGKCEIEDCFEFVYVYLLMINFTMFDDTNNIAATSL